MGSIPNGSAPLSRMRSPDLYTTLPGRTGKAQVVGHPRMSGTTLSLLRHVRVNFFYFRSNTKYKHSLVKI